MVSPGVEEEAGGGQGEAGGGRGLSGAHHASPVPTGRGRRQGGSGDGLRHAGPGNWAPGNFLLSLSLISFLFLLFCF